MTPLGVLVGVCVDVFVAILHMPSMHRAGARHSSSAKQHSPLQIGGSASVGVGVRISEASSRPTTASTAIGQRLASTIICIGRAGRSLSCGCVRSFGAV